MKNAFDENKCFSSVFDWWLENIFLEVLKINKNINKMDKF